MQAQFERLLEVARTLQQQRPPGHRGPDHPPALGQIYAEIEVLRYAALRLLSSLEKGQRPGPESSIAKLHYSELDKRVQEMMLEILGPYGQLLERRCPTTAHSPRRRRGRRRTWAYTFVWSRAGTIYAGSNEIQKNIIGERVLGLPKEVRRDRIELATRRR